MANPQLLTRKSTGWFKGCGCGQKQTDLVIPPEGSVELFITKSGIVEGPSGQKYDITPNTTTIDVRADDAAHFRAIGIGSNPNPTLKGTLSRIV